MKIYSPTAKLQFRPICLLVVLATLSTGLHRCTKPIEIIADVIPPDEVGMLQISKQDVDVVLNWQDPGDHDFRGVRISLYNAENQQLVRSANVLPDSMTYTLSDLSSGNYIVRVQTRDKENNLSKGLDSSFVFLSQAPVNVNRINTQLAWNVLHLRWDQLTEEDYTTTVEGESIYMPVDSIIVEMVIDSLGIDSLFKRYALLPADTGLVIPDLPDGRHSVKIMTLGESGYHSAAYQQILPTVNFGEKFVRVTGDGHDFYIARYEVTTEEYRQFIVDDLGINEPTAPYLVDNTRIDDDAWFKWWYGTDPQQPGVLNLLGFNTWEFSLDANGWSSNRYDAQASFGRVTWEGAMLYALVKYNGRCPTREEWLYAAKGGQLSMGYDFAGSNDPDEVGWWGWEPGGLTFLRPPGQKKPNELGIYDMSGNAAEILYDLNPGGASLGTTNIIGGSMGPIHFWGNEPEDFAPGNDIKPMLHDPRIVKHTGVSQKTAFWRMGIRVLIPREEILKRPMNRYLYER